MTGWYVAAAFILLVVARWAGQRWFMRRWLADGMSPTRAALLSLAVTQLPVIGLLLAIAWLSGGLSPRTALLLAGLFLLPSAVWLGLRRAVFQYMDEHSVKNELRRHGGHR